MCNLTLQTWKEEIDFDLHNKVFEEMQRLVYAGLSKIYFITSKEKFYNPKTTLKPTISTNNHRDYRGKHGLLLSYILCEDNTIIPIGYNSMVIEAVPCKVNLKSYERTIAVGRSNEVVVFVSDYKKDEIKIRITRRRVIELIGVYE